MPDGTANPEAAQVSGSVYYLVSGGLLPEVFRKVVQAKRLLRDGTCSTVGTAIAKAGLSRNAFYKYRDCVHEFIDRRHDAVYSISVLLRDRTGALQNLVGTLAGAGANILTINQNIPDGGRALVNVTYRAGEIALTPGQLIDLLRGQPDVVEADVLQGNYFG